MRLLVILLALGLLLLEPRPIRAAEPFRIVSLVPSSTEMLFALGVGPWIVGVDNFSNYPAAAGALPKLGDYKGVSLEAIAALRPTHLALLDDYFPQETSARLARLGIQQITCHNRNVEDVKECAILLGRAFQKEADGQAIAAKIETSRKAARAAARGARARKALIIVETEPLYAIGPRNFMHELFVDAGFVNVLEKSTTLYPMISFETVLASRPDVIITFRKRFADDLGDLYRRAHLLNQPPILTLDEEVFTRSGPRVAQAYAELARIHAQLGK